MSLSNHAIADIAFQASHYKLCMIKEYAAYVCRPPLGTLVINHLEQYRVVERLGTPFISAGQLQLLRQTGNPIYTELSRCCANHQVSITTERTPLVIAGTLGEMSIYSVDTVKRLFKCEIPSGVSCFGWHRITAKAQKAPTLAACFIPVKYYGILDAPSGIRYDVNNPDIRHGKGDFVCCSVSILGHPILSSLRVVNGLVFGNMMNNRGFSDNLAHEVSGISMTDLPDITNPGEIQSLNCFGIRSFCN